jgi:hypothetical protein
VRFDSNRCHSIPVDGSVLLLSHYTILFTYLHNSVGADIPCRRRSKDESIPLDMKVGESIRHHHDRRRIPRALGVLLLVIQQQLLLFLDLFVIRQSHVIPEFDFTKECFGMGSFVCSHFALFVDAVLLGQDGIPSRGKDEKVTNHCSASLYLSFNHSFSTYILSFLEPVRENVYCLWESVVSSQRLKSNKIVDYVLEWKAVPSATSEDAALR